MLKRVNHIHKLRRHTYKSSGKSMFFCTLPDCTFKTEVQFCLGKTVICNRCGNQFEMESHNIREVKPHCRACRKTKITDEHGFTRYVHQDVIASSIAQDRVDSLKDRLAKATTDESKEDI